MYRYNNEDNEELQDTSSLQNLVANPMASAPLPQTASTISIGGIDYSFSSDDDISEPANEVVDSNLADSQASLYGGSDAKLMSAPTPIWANLREGNFSLAAEGAKELAGTAISFVPNVAMASLMNTVDFGKDAILYGIEKVGDTYEFLSGSEAPRWTKASSFYSENPEEAKKQAYTGQEMAKTWYNEIPVASDVVNTLGGHYVTQSFDRHPEAYNLLGDFAPIGLVTGGALRATKVGSSAYKMVTTAGVPAVWARTIFWNPEVAKEAITDLKKVVVKTAKAGVNPSAIMSVADETMKVGRKLLPEAIKQTAITEAALYASGYKRDELYSDHSFTENLLYHGVIPTAVGIGAPLVSAATKVRSLFSRAAPKAESNLNYMLNNELAKQGMNDDVLTQFSVSHHDSLVNYGLAGNKASDVATQHAYSIKALNRLKENALTKLEDSPIPNVTSQDISKYYDDLIRSIDIKRSSAVSEMVAKGVSSADSDYIAASAKLAQDKWNNVLDGTKSLEMAGNTNELLSNQTGKLAEKRAKLKKRIESARTKPENKLKLAEQLQDTYEEGYQLIDKDGLVYDASDFHMRWRDSANYKEIKLTSIPVIKDSKVTHPEARLKFRDPDDYYSAISEISALPNGEVKIAKLANGKFGPKLGITYRDTSAFDPSWVMLNKVADWMTSEVATKNGKMLGIDKLISENVAYSINLSKASHQQVAFLRDIYDKIGVEKFKKLYRFDKDSLINAYQEAKSNLSNANLDMPSLLDYLHVTKAQKFMQDRMLANANKADSFAFNRFTEDSLFEELTGLHGIEAADGLANEKIVGSFVTSKNVKDTLAMVKPVNQFTRAPQKYVLQTTSQIGALDDKINNQIYQNLAERYTNKMQILLGDETNANTLVSQISKLATELPQFANGYINTPVSISYETDILGSAGKSLLTQEFRHGNNVTLQASVAFANDLNPAITKKINDLLKPLVESTKPLLKDEVGQTQFGKYWHQARAGFRLSDDFLVFDEKTGGYLVKLDDSKFATNSRVNDHLTKFSRVDGSVAIKDGYMPDPITGEPLVINKQVADLVANQHELNKILYSGYEQINGSLGKVGERPFMNGHMPAKDLSNKYIKVIVRDLGNGRLEPELFVAGDTAKQADYLAQLELKNAGLANNRGYKVLTDKEYGLDKRLVQSGVDDGYFQMADYSDYVGQMLSSGSKSGGVRTSVGSAFFVGPESLKEFIEANNRQLQRQASRARFSLFYDQIEQARTMLAGKNSESAGYLELNEYINNLVGKTTKPSGLQKAIYDGVDYMIDRGGKLVNDFARSSSYAKALQSAELNENKLRNSSKFFNDYKEVESLYGFNQGLADGLFSEVELEASRVLKQSKPFTSKETVAMLNRVATLNLLRLANLGYAVTNLVSIPAVMPMVRKSMRKLPTETPKEFQARVGAYGQVVGNGENVATDLIGGFGETVRYYGTHIDEAKNVINEASERGWLSTNAGLINEVFLNPSDALLNKAGKSVFKAFTSLGDKTEEISKIIPFLYGYRLGIRNGYSHSSSLSMARKMADNVVGNYLASNRPQLFMEGLGNLFGLFHTYIQNLTEQYVGRFLQGDSASLIAGAAGQSFMFGSESLPGSDTVKEFFMPLKKGKDFYTTLRDNNYTDEDARAIMAGIPSVLTGLDFSSKGDINPIPAAGGNFIPALTLWSNLGSIAYQSVKEYSANNELDANTVWEIMQTRLPNPLARGAINLALGYKVDRNHNLIVSKDTIGNTAFYGASLMSMNTLDERMARDAVVHKKRYDAWLADQTSQIRNNMVAAIRTNDFERANIALTNGISDLIANGADPSRIGSMLQAIVLKAYVTDSALRADKAANKRYQTARDKALAEVLKLQAITNPSYNINNADTPIVNENNVPPSSYGTNWDAVAEQVSKSPYIYK